VAFVGFMGGWNTGLDGTAGSWPAALAATLVTVWFTFVPSFGFILAGAPLVEASREDLRLGAPLTAITAAVVGVIASLAVFFAGPVLWPAGSWSPGALLVLALALVAQLKLGFSVLQVIAVAALGGVVLQLLSG
jgi:chromate transporter